MFVLSNGCGFIGLRKDNNCPTTVGSVNQALMFAEKQKALNYKENLKNTLRRFNWEVVELNDGQIKNEKVETLSKNILNVEKETSNMSSKISDKLDMDNFNIYEFATSATLTLSKLKEYLDFSLKQEIEWTDKINDIRHYLRDNCGKLNAIQMQRVGYFLQKLEKERYDYKSNRLISELLLEDFNRMKNPGFVCKIKKIKESKYQPRIYSYELIDEISGRKGKV